MVPCDNRPFHFSQFETNLSIIRQKERIYLYLPSFSFKYVISDPAPSLHRSGAPCSVPDRFGSKKPLLGKRIGGRPGAILMASRQEFGHPKRKIRRGALVIPGRRSLGNDPIDAVWPFRRLFSNGSPKSVQIHSPFASWELTGAG